MTEHYPLVLPGGEVRLVSMRTLKRFVRGLGITAIFKPGDFIPEEQDNGLPKSRFEIQYADQTGITSYGVIPFDRLVGLAELEVEVERVISQPNESRPDHSGRSWVILDPRKIGEAFSIIGRRENANWWYGYDSALTTFDKEGKLDRDNVYVALSTAAGRLFTPLPPTE